MNVWILAISAMFTPIMQPLGLAHPMVEPAPVDPPASASDTVLEDMRYPGIERLFAQLAGQD